MAGNGLPRELRRLFADGGADRVLDLKLPPGGLVMDADGHPAYWLSDVLVGPDLWGQLHRAHSGSGLWPALITEPFRSLGPRPAGEPVTAEAALDLLWTDYVTDTDPGEDDLDELEPFGRSWPGLAEPAGGPRSAPDEFADQYVRAHDDGLSRIMLAAAPRGADVLTAAGWPGAFNHTEDVDLLAAVLRGWEDRFGARLIEVGADALALSVAAPPADPETALRVAVEHFAFCPDNILQGPAHTIGAYAAAEIQGQHLWSFWWD